MASAVRIPDHLRFAALELEREPVTMPLLFLPGASTRIIDVRVNARRLDLAGFSGKR